MIKATITRDQIAKAIGAIRRFIPYKNDFARAIYELCKAYSVAIAAELEISPSMVTWEIESHDKTVIFREYLTESGGVESVVYDTI